MKHFQSTLNEHDGATPPERVLCLSEVDGVVILSICIWSEDHERQTQSIVETISVDANELRAVLSA